MSSLIVKMDVSSVVPLAANVANAVGVIRSAAARAVNAEAKETRDKTVQRIYSEVHLSETYVADHLTMAREATGAKPEAVIVAEDRPTRLDRFQTTELRVQPVKRPERSKGNRLLGIPAGKKPAGVFANVSKGRAGATITYAFLSKMRAGTVSGGGGLGVFKRVGKKLKAIFAAPISQMARLVWREDEDKIAQRLSERVLLEVGNDIGKELAR